MAYLPQRMGMGAYLGLHRGPSAVPVYRPPARTFTPAPPRAITPGAPTVIPPSQNPILGPLPGSGPNVNPYTSGQNYAYWVTQAFGAPGTATRNAVPMSCLMGGINCPAGVSGFGDYDKVGDWEWMYNPPPYDFLDPSGVKPPSGFYAPAASMGLGCGGSCGCGGKKRGMGQAAGLFGTSLFESADMSQWGIGEWGAIGLAIYLGVSFFGDAKTVQKKVRRSRSKSRRRQELLDEANSL